MALITLQQLLPQYKHAHNKRYFTYTTSGPKPLETTRYVVRYWQKKCYITKFSSHLQRIFFYWLSHKCTQWVLNPYPHPLPSIQLLWLNKVLVELYGSLASYLLSIKPDIFTPPPPRGKKKKKIKAVIFVNLLKWRTKPYKGLHIVVNRSAFTYRSNYSAKIIIC